MSEPRAATAQEIEAIFNTPAVRPSFYPQEGYVEFTDAYTGDFADNVNLVCDGCLSMFAFTRPGVYDIHLALPSYARGLRGVVAVSKCLDQMFDIYKARVITGNPYRDNRAVRLFGTRLGFRNTGTHTPTENGDVCHYTLEVETWELGQSQRLADKWSEVCSLKAQKRSKQGQLARQPSLPLSR